MQDADLFMELAAIAGVFVGFGALIAVRSGGASDAFEVAWMRGVVSIGLLAVLAALAPVAISRYDLTEHEVWALSSILFFVGFIGIFAINNLSPEARTAEDPIPTEPQDRPVRGLVALHGLPLSRPDRHRAGLGAGRRGGALLHSRRAGPGMVRGGPPDARLHGARAGDSLRHPCRRGHRLRTGRSVPDRPRHRNRDGAHTGRPGAVTFGPRRPSGVGVNLIRRRETPPRGPGRAVWVRVETLARLTRAGAEGAVMRIRRTITAVASGAGRGQVPLRHVGRGRAQRGHEDRGHCSLPAPSSSACSHSSWPGSAPASTAGSACRPSGSDAWAASSAGS